MRAVLPLLLTLGLGVAALVAAAPCARAGDDEPSVAKAKPDFLRQLSESEHAFLKKRFANWDAMSVEKRQRIAQNVVRLRSMTPQEKQRLQDHIRRMKGRSRKDHERGRFHDRATGALINRALAREARRTLGRDFERELRKRDIADHTFEMSVGHTFWRAVSTQRAAQGEPPAPDTLPEDVPGRVRAQYAQAHAAYSKLPAESKQRPGYARRMHFKLAMLQAGRFRGTVRAMDLKGDAQLDAVAKAIRAEWPEALAKVLEDPEGLLKASEKHELRRAVRRILRRTERLEKEEAAVLVSLLSRLAIHHRKDDDGAREASDALLKAVLQRELRVPAEALADLPPASEPEKRLEFFRELAAKSKHHALREFMQRGGRAPHGRRGPGGRKGRRGPR